MKWEFKTTTGDLITVGVHDRRRYSASDFYTYLYAEKNGELVDDGDHEVLESPWPMIRPPKSGIKWDLRREFDIPVTKADLNWIRKMLRENRCFVRSPEDLEKYIAPIAAELAGKTKVAA